MANSVVDCRFYTFLSFYVYLFSVPITTEIMYFIKSYIFQINKTIIKLYVRKSINFKIEISKINKIDISDSQMDDETHPRHNGLNSGAVTILVIAGVAIVSVITTMACIMINNRRQRRVQRPQVGCP